MLSHQVDQAARFNILEAHQVVHADVLLFGGAAPEPRHDNRFRLRKVQRILQVSARGGFVHYALAWLERNCPSEMQLQERVTEAFSDERFLDELHPVVPFDESLLRRSFL